MTRNVNYIQAINEALAEEMERDPSVLLMGEDVVMSAFGTTRGLDERFGLDRVRNTPIAEASIVGLALGAAIAGSRPIAELEFASLVYLAMDQIVNNAAKTRYMSGGQINAPLTIRASVAMGFSAGAQHSDTPHALFVHSPGIKVALPSGPRDAKGLLKASIRDDDPVIFFEHMGLAATSEDIPDDEVIPLGKAKVAREGSDATIIALGPTVSQAVAVAERMAERGVDVEVIDPRTFVPMDWPTLFASASKTGRVVVVDDASPLCSVASEIAASLGEHVFADLRAPVKRVAREGTPVPFSPGMEEFVMVNEQKIEAALSAVVELQGA
jgi:acetoin:2,6-dichlorophenolindophenol oxidoreductase subunit beta